MAVVVSDTTPLHYLFLVGQQSVLESLYGKVVIPPAVLAELSHASAPLQISRWAANPPAWVIVATPQSIPSRNPFSVNQKVNPNFVWSADSGV